MKNKNSERLSCFLFHHTITYCIFILLFPQRTLCWRYSYGWNAGQMACFHFTWL